MPLPTRSESQGLLIIRAWVEEGSAERLRAEVRVTTDVSAGMQHTVTLARIDEVRAMVDAWLVGVLAQGTSPVGPGPSSASRARGAGR